METLWQGGGDRTVAPPLDPRQNGAIVVEINPLTTQPMSESKLVWKPLRDAVKGFWMRIEVASFAGFPDTITLQPNNRVSLVELKYLREWPKRETTGSTLNVSGLQREFIKTWCRLGGSAYVLARVADEWLLIPGDKLGAGKFTRSEWISKSIIPHDDHPDFAALEKIL